MIKVLHIVSGLGGGVGSFLYNYYYNLDKKLIKFDFIVHGPTEGFFETKLKDMGSKVFHVTPKKKSFIRNMVQINLVIKEGEYDIVYVHQNFSSLFSLFLAKKNNVPVRIIHSHGNKNLKFSFTDLFKPMLRFLNSKYANYFFACSLESGKWLYGRSWSLDHRNYIINNAIDTNKYIFNKKIRNSYREKFNVNSNKVLIHVGRFTKEKNHNFLISLMEDLVKIDNKYILFLVGDGELRDNFKKVVIEKELDSHIKFLGSRYDIPELMNMSDVFLFPSEFEGFGIVTIEAQCTGLPVIASNTIPKSTEITPLIQYLPINDYRAWINLLLNKEEEYRTNKKTEVEAAGFSILKEADIFQQILINIYRQH